MCKFRLFASFCLLFVGLGRLSAHTRGESYLRLQVHGQTVEGNVEIHVDDLKRRFETEADAGLETDALIARTTGAVREYFGETVSIGMKGEDYPMRYTTVEHFDGAWILYHFFVDLPERPAELEVRAEMFFEKDRFHRNLLMWIPPEKKGANFSTGSLPGRIAMVFSPRNPAQTLDLANVPSVREPRHMIKEGIWHIWIGYDHILFLITLLIPTVLVWQAAERKWEPTERFSKSFFRILEVVTVFTIAHSITLGLAAFDFIRLPSRLVESVIALSIVLVAIANIRGGNFKRSIAIIFVLGLFHGLGFASVMGELPFRMVHSMALKSVLFFNFGVEMGQMAIVAAVFPLLFLLRKSDFYPAMAVRGLSGAVGVVASYWFVMRAFALT